MIPEHVDPFRVLKESIAAVPAVKYALGVVGIGAAVAIIRTLVSDLRVAFFAIVSMLMLMTVLFVFSKLTIIAGNEIRLLTILLSWFSLLLIIATGSLLFTSVFFNWPIGLKNLVQGHSQQTTETQLKPPQSAPQGVSIPMSYLRIQVRDKVTQQSIAATTIEVEDFPGRVFTTDSDGGVSIEGIPKELGDMIRIFVRKNGYRSRDEYVTLPGPITVYLEK